MPQDMENRTSSLILKEDNEQVFTLLGVRCQALATTVVQLYITEPPHHSQWLKRDTGILCFVKDNFRKNYFFRLYCLKRNAMIWEHELYNNIEYSAPCEFLHTFEGEGGFQNRGNGINHSIPDCMIAFSFANVMEAKELKIVVDRKLMVKKKREEKRNSKNVIHLQDQSPRLPSSNDFNMYKKVSDSADRLARRRRNITKADIGAPSEFRHVSHIGWDPDKGFDIAGNDPQLKTFFAKAGVSEQQLQDKDTREYIYNFISKNGGYEAVKQTSETVPAPPAPGPPVPPRGNGRPHNRAAPPPPPTASPNNNNWPSHTQKTVLPPNNIPPPPAGIAPPPPPPPPPLPPMMETSPEIEMPITQTQPQAPDMRSALMNSIRSGTTLKPVEFDKKSEEAGGDSRTNLLSEIRKGFHLRPPNEREIKPVTPPPERAGGDLASALARALAERSRAIHSEDDSTTDTDSNDDEWDA